MKKAWRVGMAVLTAVLVGGLCGGCGSEEKNVSSEVESSTEKATVVETETETEEETVVETETETETETVVAETETETETETEEVIITEAETETEEETVVETETETEEETVVETETETEEETVVETETETEEETVAETETEIDVPWKNGGKQPSEYTFEEFEALDAGQQMAFQNSFERFEEFDAWLQSVNGAAFETETEMELNLPWEDEGAKQPSEYTFEEFEALEAGQQMAFQNSFESFDEFDAWLQSVNAETEMELDLPWEEEGAKQPEEYTFEEFEALEAGQQMAFQNSFESFEEFDAWMLKANGAAFGIYARLAMELDLPWEAEESKQPEEYTWEEFEELDAKVQIAFQQSFEEDEEFDVWLQKVYEDETELEVPWEGEDSRQPDEYTWEEFEELESRQRIAFCESFEDMDIFYMWLENMYTPDVEVEES